MTKDHIEAVSNLIQASKLLGGTYREDREKHIIDLPCGRSVELVESPSLNQMWRLHPSWAKNRVGYLRKHATPSLISRFIRAAVVKNDEEIS